MSLYYDVAAFTTVDLLDEGNMNREPLLEMAINAAHKPRRPNYGIKI